MANIELYETDKTGTNSPEAFLRTGKIALTVKEAIAASGLGKTTLYELMRTGALARVKIGSRTLIRQDDLNRILHSDVGSDRLTPVSTH